MTAVTSRSCWLLLQADDPVRLAEVRTCLPALLHRKL